MRIIDRYICKEVFSHALLGLLIFTFVLFVPDLVKMMEFVVRSSAPPSRLGLLFISLFPGILTFTLPMAVLVGVLIGLGRLSADSELIALSALGVGMRRVLVPVGAFAAAATALTLSITLWLGPAAQRTFRNIQDELTASQAPFQVQPRVFDEEPKDLVLYVQNVTASGTHWRGVFLAQTQSKKVRSLHLQKTRT
jgi:lipopolysaccharide export LptBFGC system permease protein LptF